MCALPGGEVVKGVSHYFHFFVCFIYHTWWGLKGRIVRAIIQCVIINPDGKSRY